MDRKLYAQFDGDEVDGVTYALGDEIKLDKHDAGTIGYLSEVGRIAATKPATTIVLPADEGKPVEEMSRAELESGALLAIKARMSDASDDQLRSAIEEGREREQRQLQADHEERAQANGGAGTAQNGGDPLKGGDGMTGGEGGSGDGNRGSTANYDEIKDKPLGGLKTADLVLIAEHENVSLDGANTNGDRVKAIETAREAKAKAAA